MKTDSNYRMSKQIKRTLSTIMDRKERNIYKRAAIDADASWQKGSWVILKNGNDKE
jgi:hypothetical protein